MLTLLRIRNLALIDSAEIEFGRGLTVLTGESGAGKSLVMDALHLVAGAPRPRLTVRSGCRSGFVEAEFHPLRVASGHLADEELACYLEAIGFGELVSDNQGSLVLGRKLEASGRSRCFVQGQTVSRVILGRIAAHLIEICGQSEAHHLRTPQAQLEALDRFAGLSDARRTLAKMVLDLREAELAHETQQKYLEEARRREDFVRYQLDELSTLDLGDLEPRRARLEELEQSCGSLEVCGEVVQMLSQEAKIIGQLRWLSARLASDDSVDERISDQLEVAIDALCSCEKMAHGTLHEAESQKNELDELRGQMVRLVEVARKHRVNVDQLGARAEELKRELDALSELEKTCEALEEAKRSYRLEVEVLADRLHEARGSALFELRRALSEELSRVGLKGAQISAEVIRGELTTSGITHLELGFSANPGHPALSLGRVASGGELARILLAFRLATESTKAVLVFDEIDAGAGGKTAEKIARSLGKASENTQVLAVTHWPQVACTATAHIAVEKLSNQGKTTTLVTTLGDEERVGELARMLGGNDETARNHAARLLKRPEHTCGQPAMLFSGPERADQKRRRPGKCRIVAA